MNTNTFRFVRPSRLFFFGGLLFALLFTCFVFTLYMEFVSTALLRLQLSPPAATLALAGIIVGGLINIPVHRGRFPQLRLADWAMFYRNWGTEPFPIGLLRSNTIAVNIGGAVVPTVIAVWLLPRLCVTPLIAISLFVAVAVNVFVCFRLGRIVANIGIMLPGWVAPVIGVAMAWVLLPAGSPHCSSFAFVTAVTGPLIGADLLHLKDVGKLGAGIMSIGGAGPFDGIVLSGMLAAWFA